MNRLCLTLTLIAGLWLASGCQRVHFGDYEQTDRMVAHANLINAKGTTVGKATLEETMAGVKIVLSVRDQLPGWHALHIHEAGKAEAPEFKSAGGHFNPTGKKHGRDNPEGWHAGDLGNIHVKLDGTCQVTIMALGVTLKKGVANSLFHDGGTSLVIHAGEDDEMTDPAGNAGTRVVCGVIEEYVPSYRK